MSQSLFQFMSIESIMPSNHLILCHPLLLLPSIFRSIRVFPYESALHIRWPKYWSFSFSISLSNEYSGLFDLISLQSKGLRSLLQHQNSKIAILQHSAFFMVHLSHLYMIIGKTIALIFFGTLSAKWYLCFFNMLSLLQLFFQGASFY